jgi:hypothetical protein
MAGEPNHQYPDRCPCATAIANRSEATIVSGQHFIRRQSAGSIKDENPNVNASSYNTKADFCVAATIFKQIVGKQLTEWTG